MTEVVCRESRSAAPPHRRDCEGREVQRRHANDHRSSLQCQLEDITLPHRPTPAPARAPGSAAAQAIRHRAAKRLSFRKERHKPSRRGGRGLASRSGTGADARPKASKPTRRAVNSNSEKTFPG